MTALGVFRVGIFVTLKMVKQLSLSDLQVTLQLFRILVAWEAAFVRVQVPCEDYSIRLFDVLFVNLKY